MTWFAAQRLMRFCSIRTTKRAVQQLLHDLNDPAISLPIITSLPVRIKPEQPASLRHAKGHAPSR
jgi:hypothetical protein